jgi:hypothetical protein
MSEQASWAPYFQQTWLHLPESYAVVQQERLNCRWQSRLGHLQAVTIACGLMVRGIR